MIKTSVRHCSQPAGRGDFWTTDNPPVLHNLPGYICGFINRRS